MSFLAPIAGALLPAVGGLVGGLFGGAGKKAPTINYQPPGFNAGGLSATFGGGGYNVTPNAQRQQLVGGMADTFGQQASDIGGLRAGIAPGYSNLRQAQLSLLQNQRTAALGDLRDSLARRRVLGSSFAQDTLARADQEYQATQANVIAQTYLQELQANQQLIQQQYTAARGQFETGLSELNLEAGIASDLTGKASTTLAQAAQTQAQLNMFQQANQSQFGAGIGAMFGKALGGLNINSFFGGGSPSGYGV